MNTTKGIAIERDENGVYRVFTNAELSDGKITIQQDALGLKPRRVLNESVVFSPFIDQHALNNRMILHMEMLTRILNKSVGW